VTAARPTRRPTALSSRTCLPGHVAILLFLALGACPSDPGTSASGAQSDAASGDAPTGGSPTGMAPTGDPPGDQPPTAIIVADPPGGAAPLLVRLRGTDSADPEGPIAAYAWKFGDGAEASGPEVEHVFYAPGDYTVELTVTDGAGQPGSAQLPLPVSADCPTFAAVASPGTLADPAIVEASGLAYSVQSPGVLWTHNDGGDPVVHAFAAADARYLGRYALPGADVFDWEDMAVGPGKTAGSHALYVADIGDNMQVRANVTVYRAPEPPVDPTQDPVDAALGNVEPLVFTYPAGQKFDSESLLVDPVRGDLCLATKRGDGLSEIYCRTAPLTSGTLTLVASLDLASLTTAASVSPDGRLVAIRSYLDAKLWRRDPAGPLADAFKNQPCALPLTIELQGEALGFHADGLGYTTVSEGTTPALHPFRRG
jgi:hypothetical protein